VTTFGIRSGRPPSRRGMLLLSACAILLLVASFLAIRAHGENPAVPDVARYYAYGHRTAAGDVPYRDFRLEYPPAALAAFVLPVYAGAAFGSTHGASWDTGPRRDAANAAAAHYGDAFAALMVVLAAITIALTSLSLASLGTSTLGSAAALAVLGASPLLLGGVVYTRYDFWPAALCAAALAALLRGRPRLAGAALGVAVAAKLYSLVLVPLLVAHVWKLRGRIAALVSLGVAAVVSLAIFLPLLALAPGGTWYALREQAGRGLQVESLGSAALVFVHLVTGGPALRVRGAGDGLSTDELHGAGVGAADVLGFVLLACFLVALWLGYARGPARRQRLVRHAAASVLALLVFGQVLSPQLLIWLLPLVPLAGGRRGLLASVLLGVALLATHVWFTRYYVQFVERLDTGPELLLLGRDLVLVLLLATVLWPASLVHRRRPARPLRPDTALSG
jgi:hypothetical protein